MLNSLEIDERIFIRPSRLQENSLANSPYDEELDGKYHFYGSINFDTRETLIFKRGAIQELVRRILE